MWLRIFSLPSNDKIRNHLVANPILIIRVNRVIVFYYIAILYLSIFIIHKFNAQLISSYK